MHWPPKMQAREQQQHGWRISVRSRCRGNKFCFRLRATNEEPNWKWFRFSIFLRLHHFLFQLKSDWRAPRTTPRQQPPVKTKSGFPRFFPKFSTPSSEKKSRGTTTIGTSSHPSSPQMDRVGRVAKKPICVGSLLAGGVAMLTEWIPGKHPRGAVIYGLSIFMIMFILALFFKKPVLMAGARTLWISLAVTALSSAVILGVDKCATLSLGGWNDYW